MSDIGFQGDIAFEGLKQLRAPFPAAQIGKLPKGGTTLDFVGHGFLTMRLLDVDPLWTWEPFAIDDTGLPRLDAHGGLWIRLTVCGMTRIGYGDAGGKQGPNAVKEAIGDALRNAGMRFGLALDLWAKGDPDAPPPQSAADVARENLARLLKSKKVDMGAAAKRFQDDYGVDIREADKETIEAFHTVIASE